MATGKEIVNNREFLDWTLSDWDQSFMATRMQMPRPDFSEKMLETFMPADLERPPAENIRTIEQLDAAVEVLFKFRQ